jgi:hypothetical protein
MKVCSKLPDAILRVRKEQSAALRTLLPEVWVNFYRRVKGKFDVSNLTLQPL